MLLHQCTRETRENMRAYEYLSIHVYTHACTHISQLSVEREFAVTPIDLQRSKVWQNPDTDIMPMATAGVDNYRAVDKGYGGVHTYPITYTRGLRLFTQLTRLVSRKRVGFPMQRAWATAPASANTRHRAHATRATTEGIPLRAFLCLSMGGVWEVEERFVPRIANSETINSDARERTSM